jgi:uncharacterized membrane protein YgdD (TMEM256/DUF423 family)
MAHFTLAIAALNGFLAVALGAFAAHGLRNIVSADLINTFQTGVQYHMYHSLALFGLGLLMLQLPRQPLLSAVAWLFIAGIIIFSGSLYALTLSGVRWLGAITPIGGLAFLAGWLLLAWAVWAARGATV